MRRLMFAALIVLLAANVSFAQSVGLFHRARTTNPGDMYGGGYVILSGDDGFSLMGQGRMGVVEDLEAGGRLVFTRINESNVLALGGDAQYMFYRSTKQVPTNISGIGGLDISFGDEYTAFTITLGGLVDGRLKLQRGRNVYPYGGLLIVFTNWTSHGHSDSETDIALTGGTVFQISKGLALVGEIRIQDEFSIGVGLNFR